MLIHLLTVVLVLDCLFLILLVLVQLPKKEAGAGIAFGAGTTDALFGAGTGNALTKMTKYAAGIFLCLSLMLSVLNAHKQKESTGRIKELLQKGGVSSSLNVPAAAPAGTAQKMQPAAQTPAVAPAVPATTPAAPAPVAPATPPAAPKK